MKRAQRQTLFLLLAAGVLAVLTGWQLHHDAQAEAGSLTTLEPVTITQISLSLPGDAPLHYERRGDGHWWRTDETPHRVADDDRLNDLTDIAAAHVLSWRAAGDFEPAKIGLAPPRAVLVLNGEKLEFGESSVTGPQHYVRVGDRVALVSSRYMPRSPAVAVTELH
ncbi:hypothetical protein ACVWWQ_001352 [Rhodanobacter sp. TND4EL1]